MRRLGLAALGFGALIISPHAACRTSPPAVTAVAAQQSEEAELAKDMLARAEGTWVYVRPGAEGRAELAITFRMTRSSASIRTDHPQYREMFFATAHACGDYSLVAEAGACITQWHMPFDIEILASSEPLEVRSARALMSGAPNTRPDTHSLEIRIGTLGIVARVDKAGEARPTWGRESHFTLQRVTR